MKKKIKKALVKKVVKTTEAPRSWKDFIDACPKAVSITTTTWTWWY